MHFLVERVGEAASQWKHVDLPRCWESAGNFPAGTICQRHPAPVAELQRKQIGWHTSPLSNYPQNVQILSAVATRWILKPLCPIRGQYDTGWYGLPSRVVLVPNTKPDLQSYFESLTVSQWIVGFTSSRTSCNLLPMFIGDTDASFMLSRGFECQVTRRTVSTSYWLNLPNCALCFTPVRSTFDVDSLFCRLPSIHRATHRWIALMSRPTDLQLRTLTIQGRVFPVFCLVLYPLTACIELSGVSEGFLTLL